MKEINIDRIYTILKTYVKRYNIPIVDSIRIKTSNPFKILIATILSARTNDKITALVSKKFFSKIKKMDDLEKLSLKEIENLIYPVGFYKNKAKYLKKLAVIIKNKFNNKIPEDMDKLLELPGVGRKTANLVLSLAFRKPSICVDTHVHRIMNRIGYVKTKTPYQTEIELRKKLPKKYWIITNSIFVAFGQNLCRPISPFCSKCPIKKYCNKTNVRKSR